MAEKTKITTGGGGKAVGLSDKLRLNHVWVYDDKYCKLVTSNHLHPLIYKVINAYSMYIIRYINRHVECTFIYISKGR